MNEQKQTTKKDRRTSDRISLTPIESEQLFAESHGVCAICGRPLIKTKKNGTHVRVYEAAHIYPHSPTKQQLITLKDVPRAENIESPENIVFLCRNSHKIQDDQTTEQDYLELYSRKQSRMNAYRARMEISEIDIEPMLDIIIKNLDKLDPSELHELNYNPVEVAQKINEPLLQRNVLNYVTQYYDYIRIQLQQLDIISAGRSQLIAHSINGCFLKEKFLSLLLSQDDIFNAIVCWLKSKIGGSQIACEIIISFFVQTCEVFDAPAK